MNIQQLFSLIKNQSSCNPDNVKTKKDAKGKPFIFVDDFEIHDDGYGYFRVSDSRGGFSEFRTTGENVYEFFKGVYDAYLEEHNPAKSNEFYDKGFEFTLANLESSEEDATEDEEEGELDEESDFEDDADEDDDSDEDAGDEDDFEDEEDEDPNDSRNL